jgi:hypothetical protein
MAILQAGASTNLANVDANLNLQTVPGIPEHPAAGGWYSVAGQTSAVIAVSLGASVNLMSMRLAVASTRKAYVYRMRVLISVGTVGTSALVPGTLGLQRFTAQTPTGGTARTPNEMFEAEATATDMTDVRDSNAALTGTAPTWGNVVAVTTVPLFIANGAMWMEWIVEPPYPIVLAPGDGLGLRTQVAMPATQTWMYSYNAYWLEGPTVV